MCVCVFVWGHGEEMLYCTVSWQTTGDSLLLPGSPLLAQGLPDKKRYKDRRRVNLKHVFIGDKGRFSTNL